MAECVQGLVGKVRRLQGRRARGVEEMEAMVREGSCPPISDQARGAVSGGRGSLVSSSQPH